MLSVDTVTESAIKGVVISFKGDMNGTTADQLAAELKKVAEEKPGNVVLDLEGLTMMDSRSIGLLTAFRSKVRSATPTARVMAAAASPMIEKAMKLTRMNELFPLHLTVKEAVRAISEGERAPAGRR